MKAFREDLTTYLKSRAEITSHIGTGVNARMFPMIAPPGTDTPYIVGTQISSNPDYHHSGRSDWNTEAYQFDCVAGNPDEVTTLSDAIESVLEAAVGTSIGDNSSNLHSVALNDVSEDFANTDQTYRRMVDLTFNYTLSA